MPTMDSELRECRPRETAPYREFAAKTFVQVLRASGIGAQTQRTEKRGKYYNGETGP